MTRSTPCPRPTARSTWRVGAAAAGLLAATTLGAVAMQSGTAAAAPVDAGVVTIIGAPGTPEAGQPLESGGSASPFTLSLPALAGCTGDSASNGYRVQSFMVPEAVDPASLTFGPDGPLPTDFGAAYRQPLWLTTASPYVDVLTSLADTPGGPGMIPTLPDFSFEAYAEQGATLIPAGVYTIGIACTVGAASSPTQLDRYWTTRIEVVHDAADVPGGFVWEAMEVTVPTTTTTTTIAATTTTTAAASTTTSTSPAGGSSTTTSTTVAGTSTSTSSTVAGGASTSTSLPSVATPVVGGAPTGGGIGSGAGVSPSPQLAQTGSSSWQLVIWAALLLVFGRMALLLGRTPKVIDHSR